MPRRCCVPDCTSNSSSGVKCSVFKFPSSNELKYKWTRNIHRENGWKPTDSSGVCIEHFESECIKRENVHGSIITPLKHVQLKPDAIPTIFTSLPKYLSIVPSKPRKDPEVRQCEIESRFYSENIQAQVKNVFNFFLTSLLKT